MTEQDTAAQGGQDFEDGPPDNGVMPPSPPPQPAPIPMAPAPNGDGPRGHRGRSKAASTGVGEAPKPTSRPRGKPEDMPSQFDPKSDKPSWSSHEADKLWPEVMQWLEAHGRSAYDVTINVVRVEPPPRAAVGDGFEANAAAGDQSSTPSDSLRRIIEDYYHLPVARTPAKYELQFVWRANGHYITHGYMLCGNPQEIITLRNAAWQRRMMVPQQQPAPGGFGFPPSVPGQPPQQPQQPPMMQPYFNPQPPPFYGPGMGHGYPPPPNPQMSDLERRFAALEEENRRLRAERSAPPRAPHPGVGAPPPAPVPQPQPITEQGLAVAIATALKAAGVGAAPTAAPSDVFQIMGAGLRMMREFKKFGEEASDMFEPDDPEPRALPQTTGTGGEIPPLDDSPYDITELPSQWDDGTKAKLVRDRETGKVDWLGLAMLNPRPTQKLVDAAASFMERFGRRGLGEAPEEETMEPEQQQTQPQFQPPQQQPAPLPPPAEGTAPSPPPGGGWGDAT